MNNLLWAASLANYSHFNLTFEKHGQSKVLTRCSVLLINKIMYKYKAHSQCWFHTSTQNTCFAEPTVTAEVLAAT
jgi:hypothetical protein